MTDRLRSPGLQLRPDEPPYSEVYRDHYFSRAGGLAETRHVFLAGNGLPQRWRDRARFVIGETGFGTGLNFLASWQAWRDDPERCARLHYLAVEKHPLSDAELRAVLSPWRELTDLPEILLAVWPLPVPGFHRLVLDEGRVVLTLLFGDAAEWLPQLRATVDAWYLDGFAPARNPDPWQPAVLREIARLTRPGGTLATYTVAGMVRRGLAEAGLNVAKRPGFGGKREMLIAERPGEQAETSVTARSAIVVGAGLAGTAVARALAERDWTVALFDRHPAAGREASGNPAGVAMPRPTAVPSPDGWFHLQAYQYLLALLARLQPGDWHPCGALLLASSPVRQRRFPRYPENYGLPPKLARWVEPKQAAELAGGLELGHAALYFPQAGWLRPAALCRALAEHANIIPHYRTAIAGIADSGQGWRALDGDGRVLAEADVMILANATGVRRFPQAAGLPLIPARGQLSTAPATPVTRKLRCVLYGKGYLIPADEQDRHIFGASLIPGDADPTLREADDVANLDRLRRLLPEYADELAGPTQGCFSAVRATTPDRLPLIGVIDPAQPGLYALTGLGARGIVTGTLGAELLAARLNDEPWPVAAEVGAAVDPLRFYKFNTAAGSGYCHAGSFPDRA